MSFVAPALVPANADLSNAEIVNGQMFAPENELDRRPKGSQDKGLRI